MKSVLSFPIHYQHHFHFILFIITFPQMVVYYTVMNLLLLPIKCILKKLSMSIHEFIMF